MVERSRARYSHDEYISIDVTLEGSKHRKYTVSLPYFLFSIFFSRFPHQFDRRLWVCFPFSFQFHVSIILFAPGTNHSVWENGNSPDDDHSSIIMGALLYYSTYYLGTFTLGPSLSVTFLLRSVATPFPSSHTFEYLPESSIHSLPSHHHHPHPHPYPPRLWLSRCQLVLFHYWKAPWTVPSLLLFFFFLRPVRHTPCSTPPSTPRLMEHFSNSQ